MLEKNKLPFKATQFNKLLEQQGFLETKQRPSSSGTKNFRNLTPKGLKYGINKVNPNNQNETQPHYFEDTFMDLFNLVVNDHMKQAA